LGQLVDDNFASKTQYLIIPPFMGTAKQKSSFLPLAYN